MDETILSILQGDNDHNRVVVVHKRGFGTNCLLLRRESYSDAIGWFEQSSIEMSPDQVGQLKQSLGAVAMSKAKAPRTNPIRRFDADHRGYAAIGLAAQNAG